MVAVNNREETVYSEEVYKAYGGFGGAYVVVVFVFGNLCAALGAGVDIGACVNPSEAYLSLDVPVFSEYPGVSVGESGAKHPSLIAVVGEVGKVGSEKLDVVVEITHIVLARDGVDTEEMTLEAIAQPIPRLGLQEPVFPLVLVDSPCVEVG